MRRDLEKEVVGKKVRDVEVRPHRNAMRVIRRPSRRKEFADRLSGRKFTKIDRKGKYLLLYLDGGDVLVVHFGMSGQLLRGTKRQTLPQHTHVVIDFQQGGDLRFIDPRTFGEMFVTAVDQLGKIRVLEDAVRFRGTTLDDDAYVDVFGKSGDFAAELKVYGRKGLACRRCRTPIDTVKISGRTSYFCPQCQS